MTREEIIRMAREAGFSEWAVQTPKDLERFAALVAAAERDQRAFEIAESYRCGWDGGVKAEREACARLCEELDGYPWAKAIRARGEKRTCPECEYQKQRAALWRHEAYRLGGTPLPWDADVAIAKAVSAEREACAQVAEECLTRGRSPLERQVAEVIRARGEG